MSGTAHSVKKQSGGIWETVRTVIYAVLIAIGIRTFAYEPFHIPSGSMIPTLLVGDYLFVSKLSYGYSKYTLAFGIPLFDGRLFFDSPERGDVAVFKLPADTSATFIKRIIGLPGDRVQVVQGRLYINGELVPRRQIEDYLVDLPDGRQVRVPQYIETLPGGREHRILESRGDAGFGDNTQEYVVPDGHYFMMGDNRDSSRDSRVLAGVGYIPVENLVGRADLLAFSIEGARFYEIWKWPTNLRLSRLFASIE